MESQQQQKILIVDNDERVVHVLDSFLANAGLDIRTASDGRIALDILQSQECDLVLVADHLADFSLNGFLSELQRFATRHSVIVMESDPPRSWDAGPCRAVGASKAVNKWRPCEVLGAVSEVLSTDRLSKH